MNRTELPSSDTRELGPAEIYSSLQRRDWELWSIALLLMTVFAGGLLAYFYYDTTEERVLSSSVARFVWLVLFGLVALVLLLNIYLIARKRALADLWQRYLLQMQELEAEQGRSMLDPLTHAYNRRFFDEVVDKEIHRCNRTERPLSFLLVDLDDFKAINRQHGHFVGDELLREAANLFQGALRASDYTFRFGGDEFMLVLPDTPAEGAAVIRRRVQERLAARSYFRERIGRALTTTIAQATYTKGRTLDEVVAEAERGLEAARARTSLASAES